MGGGYARVLTYISEASDAVDPAKTMLSEESAARLGTERQEGWPSGHRRESRQARFLGIERLTRQRCCRRGRPWYFPKSSIHEPGLTASIRRGDVGGGAVVVWAVWLGFAFVVTTHVNADTAFLSFEGR